MATMTMRAEPINRDIALFLDSLSDQQAGREFGRMAAGHIADANATNTRVLGREAPHTTYIDGRSGAALATATLRSVIFTEWELILETLAWIADQLEMHSPVKTGRYKKSHILLADGVEIDPHTDVLAATEYTFTNVQPYARKLERGLSSQAPDGVYQVVAALARRRLGKIARVTFSYRSVVGGERNPAIIVRIA